VGDEITCSQWWSPPPVLVGVSDTPNDAFDRLRQLVGDCRHETWADFWLSYTQERRARTCRQCRKVDCEPNPDFYACSHEWTERELVFELRDGRRRLRRESRRCGSKDFYEDFLVAPNDPAAAQAVGDAEPDTARRTDNRRRALYEALAAVADEDALHGLIAARGLEVLDFPIPYLVVAARNRQRDLARRRARETVVDPADVEALGGSMSVWDPLRLVVGNEDLRRTLLALAEMDDPSSSSGRRRKAFRTRRSERSGRPLGSRLRTRAWRRSGSEGESPRRAPPAYGPRRPFILNR
jgi:hypothetical protein